MNIDPKQLQFLCDLARRAGREIMSVYEGAIEVRHKDDASPLTEADLRANAVIEAGLREHFPEVPVWSEESPKPASPAATFFLVDPLDGTKEFVKRNGEFTVNIALVSNGRAVAGVVFAPAMGDLFYAAEGQGAWHQHDKGEPVPMRIEAAPALEGLRVVGSRSHGGDETAEWLKQRLTGAYEFVAVGSSLKICRLAQGKADLYPRLGPTSQWDTAAAHAVLTIAGGKVVNLQGDDLLYGMERELLNPYFVALAHPSLHALVKSAT